MKPLLLILILLFSACSSSSKINKNEHLEHSKKNHRLNLHDIWALISIKRTNIDPKDFQKHPQLEINLTHNRVMGNDGCNEFMGALKTVNSKDLAFDKLTRTRMACPSSMKLSNELHRLLHEVHSYQLINLELILYNSSGTELLRYKKVD